jgi:hypothetical protein
MQRVLGRLGRLTLLLVAVVAVSISHPVVSHAQGAPQCSDGIDNDSDGAIDGADAGCAGGDDNDETDSPYSGIQVITVALPIVTLQGSVDAHGALKVTRFTVNANRGTVIDISCSGRHCPFKRFRRTMLSTSLRLKPLERTYSAPQVLRMRLQRQGQLGKFVRYTLRPNKAPKRFDSCLDPITQKVRGCFAG